MAYFNFEYVTDPPNDETVDFQTQLNNNWQEVANKIEPFNQQPGSFGDIPVPVGTECFDPDPTHASWHRIAVWTGSIWARSLNHQSAWTDWQPITVRAPHVARPLYEPEAKVDAIARRVVLRGGVLFNAAADPWPTGTTYEITSDAAIQPELVPVNGGESIQQGATGQILTAGGFAGAIIYINRNLTPDRVSINVRYQGDAGGGNFVMLDGIEWWF
ncbi:hypothetical protein [Streptomyces rochei]|uniref:hypothetical protein n=1 Tax=Streptomyces rochei TaxID=1928 RepID=UPI0036CAAB42